jgi:hypothetical protein
MRTRVLLVILVLSAAAQAQNGFPVPAAGNVTLPLVEYNKLVELAGQPPKKPDTPPYPFVVDSVQMNLEVKGESVSGTIVLEGEVFANNARKVPLVTGMTILSAQQQSRELPIEQSGGVHSALLSGPGAFSVTLETGLPLTVGTGRASFSFPVPTAGAARLTLSVPGDQTLVNLMPGLITGRSSNGGRTIVEATLVPGQTANLWWAARLSDPLPLVAPKEVRFLSDVKTLISVSEADLTVTALAEITVVQGEPAQFAIQAPDGYELTGATGATLTTSELQGHAILLNVGNTAARSHQFLLSLAKSNMDTKADIPLVSFEGAQRETGEVLVEGDGAIELSATGAGGLRRMDLKETSPYLRALARATLQAAFRYQKRPSQAPAVTLEWVRFPNSSVLSAVGQKAAVTTLVTSEGRSLTEVKLTLRNQSQPFLKLALPAGASILTSEVAGEKVKPVQGADGNRVPLLRPGFRPTGPYTVSFVFLHAGAPFAKKGGAALALPKMDIPVGLVEWEVFLPERYKVTDFGGDATRARLYPSFEDLDHFTALSRPIADDVTLDSLAPGQIGGIVKDPAGGLVPGASVTVLHIASQVTQRTFTDREGRWLVSNVAAGRVRITASAAGFQLNVREIEHDASRGIRLSTALQVGAAAEMVTVEASTYPLRRESKDVERDARQNAALADTAASVNVSDLQRRVVGVLPIAMNVPRTGNSYRFVRPLVVDEETTLTFNYRSK